MKKTLIIDGKEVSFKATASTTIRYRKKFGCDLIKDLNKLKEINGNEISSEVLEIFAKFAYIMAKQADETIPEDMWDWLDGFEVFSYEEVYTEIMDLWAESLGTTVEIKKA